MGKEYIKCSRCGRWAIHTPDLPVFSPIWHDPDVVMESKLNAAGYQKTEEDCPQCVTETIPKARDEAAH